MKTYTITLSFLFLGLIIQAQDLIVEGTAKVGLRGEGNVLLELNSERSWVFKQLGTGASTALELTAANPNNNNKSFFIKTTGRFHITHMDTITNSNENVVRRSDGSLAVEVRNHQIGDLAHGGIVFFVNATGTHGLVAANLDQHGSATWPVGHDELSNPSQHDAEGAKYFDWRLPSKWELNKMWENLHRNGCPLDSTPCATSLGGFSSSFEAFYWSSIDIVTSLNAAWAQNFDNGDQEAINMAENSKARAVRAF